jgi:aminoglycoside 3-N-acetyltransferase
MLELSNDLLERSLKQIGIEGGDGLLVHSAIRLLGRPVNGLRTYLDVIQNLITAKGTLVVPTFTLDYPSTQVFDREDTPSRGMGSFSEFVRQLPGTLRTSHPLQSVAAFGYFAEDLAVRDTSTAFESGSVFERMLELDFKLLLLGADIQAASMVHYCEVNARVPYRKLKAFPGRVNQGDQWIQKSYKMYARILEIDPQLQLQPIQLELERRGDWREVPLNYGKVACCKLKDFVKAGNELLDKDPWILVRNKEEAKHYLTRMKDRDDL